MLRELLQVSHPDTRLTLCAPADGWTLLTAEPAAEAAPADDSAWGDFMEEVQREE